MLVIWLSFFLHPTCFYRIIERACFFFGSGHVHEYFLVPVCLRDIFLKNTPIPQK